MAYRFKNIHFTESNIRSYSIEEQVLILTISNIIYVPDEDEPVVDIRNDMQEDVWQIAFQNIASFRINIWEYVDELRGNLKPPYKVDHNLEESSSKGSVEYFIEGVMNSPQAWSEWEIFASSFNLIRL